jgi:hypothetical protein
MTKLQFPLWGPQVCLQRAACGPRATCLHAWFRSVTVPEVLPIQGFRLADCWKPQESSARISDNLAEIWQVTVSKGTVRDRIPVGGEIFRTRPDRPWGPPSLLYNVYRVFPWAKSSGAWRWLSTPSSVEVKERVELNLYFTAVSSWPILGWPLLLPVVCRVRCDAILYPVVLVVCLFKHAVCRSY